MVLSMSDLLKTCCRLISLATLNTTSSPVSADGLTPCALQDGPTIGQSGRGVVHVNLSARQAKEKGLLTSGTYGRPGYGLRDSDDLASFLGSKLRTLLSGSTLFKATWKQKATPAGTSYWAHTVSVLRTSDNDCTGWPRLPTPTRSLGQQGGHAGDRRGNFQNLADWFAKHYQLRYGNRGLRNDGIPAKLALSGFGNAIQPQTAAAFIQACSLII